MKKVFFMLLILTVSFLFLAGCGDGKDGKDGEAGKDAKNMITVMSDEKAGENCENGGVRIETGFDEDGDGKLSEEEVNDTKFICNSESEKGEDGADGKDGAKGDDGACADNVAPVIESIEINGTLFDGTPVSIDDYEANVVVTTNKPEMLTITGGGKSLIEKTGESSFHITLTHGGTHYFNLALSDGCQIVNSNFALQTAYTYCSGYYEIETAKDLELIKECDAVYGLNIHIDEDEIELPKLKKVASDFDIHNSDLVSLNLPQLKYAGGLYINNNSALEIINVPELLEAGYELSIEYNPELLSFKANKVEYVNSIFSFNNNNAATTVELKSLKEVGANFYIYENAKLESFDFSALSYVDNSFQIFRNPKLPTKDAEDLRNQVENRDGIGGALYIDNNKPTP
ncbi:MAG: DUF7151 family protein [bacterium]